MSHKSGFTLIELLLVIVIIGVISAISVPSFVRSMRGNRLRSAARIVASAGRYARSMAVLHQRPMAITFDLAGGAVVVDLATVHRPSEHEEGADIVVRSDRATLYPEDDGLPAQAGDDEASGPAIRIERKLDGVRIARVDLDVGGWGRERPRDSGQDEHERMVYGSNGRCQPYQVVLQDDQGQQLVVVVDALGGTKIRER